MRPDLDHLENYRWPEGPIPSRTGDRHGVFYIRRGSITICVLAAEACDLSPWEHVSAHVKEGGGKMRVPTWGEMCWLKDQFWNDAECVIQYHPPRSDWVNTHPFVLHLWKPVGIDLPRPPIFAV